MTHIHTTKNESCTDCPKELCKHVFSVKLCCTKERYAPQGKNAPLGKLAQTRSLTKEDKKGGVCSKCGVWKGGDYGMNGNGEQTYHKCPPEAPKDWRIDFRENFGEFELFKTSGNREYHAGIGIIERYISNLLSDREKEIVGILEGLWKDDKCYQDNKPGMHYECDCSEKISYNEALSDAITKINSK